MLHLQFAVFESKKLLSSAIGENDLVFEIVHKHGNAVLVSKQDWDAMVETAYLSHGANGHKLRQAIAELDAGGGVTHDLIDVE